MKLTPDQHKEIEKALWYIEFRGKDLQYDLFDLDKLNHINKNFYCPDKAQTD